MINKAGPGRVGVMLFMFQVTASYYLCWFTLRRVLLLKRFGFRCQVQNHRRDYRDMDKYDWGCAMLSFCPGVARALTHL